MIRRLRVTVCVDGPDAYGHRGLAENIGGRTNERHSALLRAWRQVCIVAGGNVLDRNAELLLRDTHVQLTPMI